MDEPANISKIAAVLQQTDHAIGHLEEDTCIFSIHSNHQSTPIKLQLESYWQSTHFNYSARKTEFIWHCGYPPSLKPLNDSRLDGGLNYGISLQDEWFLVWCLFEISKKFDCHIQIHDHDGELLLIEVADHLPRWITPDLAPGRVWIKAGSIHLIPPELTPSTHGPLTPDVASEILRSTSHSTISSETINSSIASRIQAASPEALTKNHLFNTEAYLHPDIAKALHADPNLIGLAVQAFCEKDADSFKVCREMRRFSPQIPSGLEDNNRNPETSSKINLPYLVRMTRPLFAMLMNQESTFHPPKPFEKVGWINDNEGGVSEWTRRLVGMKILCGFEMMLSADDLIKRVDGKTLQKPPRRYQIYLDKLQSCSYFGNEMKGSAKWVELEAIALKAYLNSLRPTDIVGRFDRAIIKSAPTSMDIISPDCVGESDEWLTLNEEQIKLLFREGDAHPVEADSSPLNKHVQDADVDMKKMADFTSQVEKFVDTRGSLEGALHSDDEISSGSDCTTSEDSEQEALRANIFPSKSKTSKKGSKSITKTTNDAEIQKRLDTIVPGLSDGEWGRSTQQSDSFRSRKNQVSCADTQPIEVHEAVDAPTQKKRSLRRLTEQSYDGVCEESSCDESDSDNLDIDMENPDAAMMDDIDMDAERDAFLQFAREALGLSSEQYEAILEDRKERGVYVPPTEPRSAQNETKLSQGDEHNPMSDAPVDPSSFLSSSSLKGKQRETSSDLYSSKLEKSEFIMSQDDTTDQKVPDMNLDTFDKLMNRMDQELEKRSKAGGPIPTTGLGPNLGGSTKVDSDNSSDSEPEMGEINQAMQNELADLMKESGVDLEGRSQDKQQMNYNLISNFLESYKSQVGLPGPVGNIAGRIGLNLHPQSDKNS